MLRFSEIHPKRIGFQSPYSRVADMVSFVENNCTDNDAITDFKKAKIPRFVCLCT